MCQNMSVSQQLCVYFVFADKFSANRALLWSGVCAQMQADYIAGRVAIALRHLAAIFVWEICLGQIVVCLMLIEQLLLSWLLVSTDVGRAANIATHKSTAI